MRVVEIRNAGALLQRLSTRDKSGALAVERKVRRIVSDVRAGGDRALKQYAHELDGLRPGQPLSVTREEMNRAWSESAPAFRRALEKAAQNIRRFAEWQRPREWLRKIDRGVSVGQIVRPIESAGCYVPGGRYPLPSTLLMTVLPAQVAGVERIVVVSPSPRRETLAAAKMLGIREFYRIGGAQAIAALALGTSSIAPVKKIVGPGNRFVTAAKKLIASECSIDFLAGPTEVVIAATQGDARFIAADLVAQAEHDPEALPVFITTSRPLAQRVILEAAKLSERNPVSRESLARNGMVLLANSRGEMIRAINRIAPEHLTIPKELVPDVRNAGSVFIGKWTPEAAGDYASGPNHVLPTGGGARLRGGLGTFDFVKLISIQNLTKRGLAKLGPIVTQLAEGEGLRAHANSIRVRLGRRQSSNQLEVSA